MRSRMIFASCFSWLLQTSPALWLEMRKGFTLIKLRSREFNRHFKPCKNFLGFGQHFVSRLWISLFVFVTGKAAKSAGASAASILISEKIWRALLKHSEAFSGILLIIISCLSLAEIKAKTRHASPVVSRFSAFCDNSSELAAASNASDSLVCPSNASASDSPRWTIPAECAFDKPSAVWIKYLISVSRLVFR